MTPNSSTRYKTLQRRLRRALGPAMARPPFPEVFRAAFGAGLAILLCGGMLAVIGTGAAPDVTEGLVLIAPLGATAFLVLSLPNSPLAQPWSAIVGNTVAACVGVASVLVIPSIPLAAATAVVCTIVLMAALRALHPPAAAVGLATVLSEPLVGRLGFSFVLMPVLLDTVVIVTFAAIFNRVTGRRYPAQIAQENRIHDTDDTRPDLRLGLSRDELDELLDRHQLSANVTAEDLVRLLADADAEVANRRFGAMCCKDVMSRHVITVTAETELNAVAALFRRHRFKTLPVMTPEGGLCGIISQGDMIRHAYADAERDGSATASAIMTRNVRTVTPDTPVADLIGLLADGSVQAAPVVEEGRIAGLMTRSDLLAVLAQQVLRPEREQLQQQ